MTDSRGLIEQAPLAAPGAPSIGEGDRSRVFGMVGKQLDNIINGPGSYYPEGHKKSPDALLKDLSDFYGSVELLGKQLDDPSNIMGSVLDELKKFNDAFSSSARWSTPSYERDKGIELPSGLIPKTQDQNVIEIDPFGGPFAPPMPWKVPKKDRSVSAGGPEHASNVERPIDVFRPGWSILPDGCHAS